ncbi:MAG: hypothetical protein F6K26_16825, partial [Moorea sp. SIO2I5]|nr:hypothetical protein [Moorena sp. SIO2I5]
MSKLIRHMVIKIQQYNGSNQQRNQALAELVEQILRTRKVCRPRPGHPLSGIYLEIYWDFSKISAQIKPLLALYLTNTSIFSWSQWTKRQDMALRKASI